MTTYSDLLALGYTREDMDKASAQTQRQRSPRQFGLVVAEQDGGDPVVGVSYQNDYRTEEEWGVSNLRKALHGDDRWNQKMIRGAENHVGQITDVPEPTLLVSARGFSDIDTARMEHVRDGEYGFRQPDYDTWYPDNLAQAQGIPEAWGYRYKKMDQLRAIAAEKGVEKPARTKDALIAQITATAVPDSPDIWPGWFHYGNLLILRAGGGIVADLLKLLHKAGRETKTLALGSGGFGPFASGLTLFNSADLSKQHLAARLAEEKWTKKQEKALEPVAKKLREEGYGYYALGSPRRRWNDEPEGTVKYWLNGYAVPIPQLGGKRVQPSGWYTLDELLAHKFLEDAADRDRSRK